MRFSNIHSWMSAEPAHCVASATAIEVRSAGNAGQGPSWTLILCSPTSRAMTRSWPPGTMTSLPSSSRAQAEAVEDEADHAQVAGDRVADAQLAAGDARERHERADLDVVGADRVIAAVQLGGAVDGQHVGADALDVGAHLHEHAREVLDVRLAGGVADDRRARACAAAASSAFSVAITDGSSMKTSPARSPRGRAQVDVAAVLEGRAERGEGVEVRVQAPAADDVAAGRRHAHAAEAREQRAGEQERGADALRQLAVDDRLVGGQVRRRRARPRGRTAT